MDPEEINELYDPEEADWVGEQMNGWWFVFAYAGAVVALPVVLGLNWAVVELGKWLGLWG